MEVLSPSHPASRVCLRSASQMMKTRLCLNLLAFAIAVDPGPFLFVEPTQADAEAISKDRVEPMLRDTPALHGKIVTPKSRASGNTIEHKRFLGGSVTFAYATAPNKLRMRAVRYVIFDECSAKEYTNREGDAISQGTRRTTTFDWNKKIVYASTPLNDGRCRITQIYEVSDQRKWHLSCPFCNYQQVLVWPGLVWSRDGRPIPYRQKSPTGAFVDAEIRLRPKEAHYQCASCRGLIPHEAKYEMNAQGRWIKMNPEGEFPGFDINQLVSPVRDWGDIAQEWTEAEGKPEQERVFVNTVLAETWKEPGEEPPDEEKLQLRAQQVSKPDPLPPDVLFIVAGVDVQHDRLEVQIRGWGRRKNSWLIAYHVIPGEPQSAATWAALDGLLATEYSHASGVRLPIIRVAIDSGDSTQQVYDWVRKQRTGWVIATKGYATGIALLGIPKHTEVSRNGKKVRRGVKVWRCNVSMMKSTLYGWLKQPAPGPGEPYPVGWLQEYEAGSEYFAQLTAEVFQKGEWVKRRQRNEALDTFGECLFAAEHFGMSRFSERDWRSMERFVASDTGSSVTKPPAPTPPPDAAIAPTDAGAQAPAVVRGEGARSKRVRFARSRPNVRPEL